MNWVLNTAAANLMLAGDGALGGKFNACQALLLRAALGQPVNDWQMCQ